MSLEALSWVVSIFLWLFFTGVGIPPVPEEAGILYAASVAGVRDDVPWWAAWPAASLGIVAADLVLYGVGYWLGPRVFEYRLVQRVLSPERRQRLEGHFRSHGVKFLQGAGGRRPRGPHGGSRTPGRESLVLSPCRRHAR